MTVKSKIIPEDLKKIVQISSNPKHFGNKFEEFWTQLQEFHHTILKLGFEFVQKMCDFMKIIPHFHEIMTAS
jgi:hypothetical protein